MSGMFLNEEVLDFLGMLDSNGSCNNARGGIIQVSQVALVLMKGLEFNGLYTLRGEIVTGATLKSTANQTPPNWGICILGICAREGCHF